MSNEEQRKMMSEMTKEILDRGYITHALTNRNGMIIGMADSTSSYNPEMDAPFYWSEVYCEAGYMATVIRKGMLLVNPTREELDRYLCQSIVNLRN